MFLGLIYLKNDVFSCPCRFLHFPYHSNTKRLSQGLEDAAWCSRKLQPPSAKIASWQKEELRGNFLILSHSRTFVYKYPCKRSLNAVGSSRVRPRLLINLVLFLSRSPFFSSTIRKPGCSYCFACLYCCVCVCVLLAVALFVCSFFFFSLQCMNRSSDRPLAPFVPEIEKFIRSNRASATVRRSQRFSTDPSELSYVREEDLFPDPAEFVNPPEIDMTDNPDYAALLAEAEANVRQILFVV